MTQPAAIRAAPEVCISFQVVSESMPMPPQGSITKLLMGRSATGAKDKLAVTTSKENKRVDILRRAGSILWRLCGLEPKSSVYDSL